MLFKCGWFSGGSRGLDRSGEPDEVLPMKRTIVILAVATASIAGFSQPPQNSSRVPDPAATSAAAAKTAVPLVKKESAQVQAPAQHVISTPLTDLTKPVVTHKVWSVDGMSSRPWMQTVGTRPGFPVLPAPEMHESSMYLFWIGRDPH